MNIKTIIKRNHILLGLAAPIYRVYLALKYMNAYTRGVFRWLVTSRELTNHTYNLPLHNVRELAHVVSHALDTDPQLVEEYFDELESDSKLRDHIARVTKENHYGLVADHDVKYGQRLAWYAVVRLCKPNIVVETGLDKGLGTCALAAALMKNASDGDQKGKLLAVDIDPDAGWLVRPPYDETVEFLIDDSLLALASIKEPIDLFIYDSVRNSTHEQREYEIISDRLRPGSIIISTTTHHSMALMDFARERKDDYYSWLEIPKGHFYQGGGLGIIKTNRDATV